MVGPRSGADRHLSTQSARCSRSPTAVPGKTVGTTTATILCDSRSALQATQNPEEQIGTTNRPRNPPGGHRGSSGGNCAPLQWLPGHCDNPGNDAADRLAKDAANPGKTHPFRPLLTRKKALHPEQYLRSVGARMEVIPQRQPSTKNRQHTTGHLHEESYMAACLGTGRTC